MARCKDGLEQQQSVANKIPFFTTTITKPFRPARMSTQRILGQLAAMVTKRSEADKARKESKATLKDLRHAYNSQTLPRASFEGSWDAAVSVMDAAEQQLRNLDERIEDLTAQLRRTTERLFGECEL